MRRVDIGAVTLSNDAPLTLIAGPCQLETRDAALTIAESLATAAHQAGAGFIFKSSFDKANRTSATSPRGPGLDAGLEILAAVKREVGCPILTDVHLPEQCSPVAEVANVLQIPAFLCRQTDLLTAAARTDAAINIKKGQFLAPWDILPAAEKITSEGNTRVLLTERGTSFGYNTLVTDMRSLPLMIQSGFPVIMDATHAVQSPGGQGATLGGDRRFVPTLARASVALGIAGIFMECHPDPDNAPSDGPNMVPLSSMPALIKSLMEFDALAKADPVRL
jgi:2-dehydro-3-deoxyphosphooctonate aldolase (KDO 8-P synthase)